MSSIAVSIIIPAFNEERRLPPTIVEAVDFFDILKVPFEILVVNDGSSDGTAVMVQRFMKLHPTIKLINMPENRGKGAAVRAGVQQSRGELVLFADADGSTPMEEFHRLKKALAAGAEIAIGSRAIGGDETKVVTAWYRKFLGRLFNACVNAIVLPGVADTQCGFKLFTRKAAVFLFTQQQSDGYSFDVELLYIARRAGIVVTEVAVNWRNIPGSKVNLVLDAARMFRDVIHFKVRHRTITPTTYQQFLAS